MKDKNNNALQRLWLRHRIIYRSVMVLISVWIRRKFNFSCDGFDPRSIEGPVIVIPNHSCAWDPLLMASAFKKRQMYFVASEHLLRTRFWGPIINFLVAPIPRKKASSGSSAVIAMLRHIKAGHSICLFAEGEQSWDGLSGHVFPATGKLIKQSGATLVTYRLEGAYLSLPRWAKGVRRGRVQGSVAGVYTPEMLKGMKAGEIDALIDKDIFVDTWKWQEEQPGGAVNYVPEKAGNGAAARLDKALFMCPECGKTGTLSSRGNSVSCSCGFSAEYLSTGFFDPPKPFANISEWDAWERKELGKRMEALEPDHAELIFEDPEAELSAVEGGHRDSLLCSGKIMLGNGPEGLRLSVGDRSFLLTDIETMAPVLSSLLLLSDGEGYYQIRSPEANLRKYLLAWQYIKQTAV
jgi:1-acyl-sn-glycerol-3-phosphate acyltransferase